MDPHRLRRRFTRNGDSLESTEEPLTPLAPDRVTVAIRWAARSRLPLGSELMGEVVDAGALAEEWRGRTVVIPRLLPCGECDACRRGVLLRCLTAVTTEGLVSHRVVPARFLLEPLDVATRSPGALLALIDALATPYAGLARAGLQPGDSLIGFGGGPRSLGAQRLADYLAAKWTDTDTASAVPSRRLLATDSASVAAAFGASAAGDVVLLLDDTPSPASLPAHADLTILRQGPAHPDLLPELDALVAQGALAVDDLAQEVPFVALFDAPDDDRLRWAPLPR